MALRLRPSFPLRPLGCHGLNGPASGRLVSFLVFVGRRHSGEGAAASQPSRGENQLPNDHSVLVLLRYPPPFTRHPAVPRGIGRAYRHNWR